VALLALEPLPLAEQLYSDPALQLYDVGPAWSELLRLLCLLLRTQCTQALALARGAGAAVRRALPSALVRCGWVLID